VACQGFIARSGNAAQYLLRNREQQLIDLLGEIPGRRYNYREILPGVIAAKSSAPRFRALIPGSHTKAYERRKASNRLGAGLAGAFSQLLEKHPKLEQLVRQLIADRDVLLVQKGDHTYLRNLRNAHNRFTAACRSLGLTANDYPLNRKRSRNHVLSVVI